MPIFVPEIRHHQSQSPPEYACRGQMKLLFFFLQCAIMMFAISLFLFFMGFAAFILIHFLFLSNTFSRRCNRQFRLNSSSEADSVDRTILSALPVNYDPAVYPGRSDCTICLDCFQEGDECRSLPACEHFFHAECVDKWITKNPTCPICRTGIDIDPSLQPRINDDNRRNRLWVFEFTGRTSG